MCKYAVTLNDCKHLFITDTQLWPYHTSFGRVTLKTIMTDHHPISAARKRIFRHLLACSYLDYHHLGFELQKMHGAGVQNAAHMANNYYTCQVRSCVTTYVIHYK